MHISWHIFCSRPWMEKETRRQMRNPSSQLMIQTAAFSSHLFCNSPWLFNMVNRFAPLARMKGLLGLCVRSWELQKPPCDKAVELMRPVALGPTGPRSLSLFLERLVMKVSEPACRMSEVSTHPRRGLTSPAWPGPAEAVQSGHPFHYSCNASFAEPRHRAAAPTEAP